MGSRRHASLIPLSRDHHAALALAFRLQHPAPPGPVTPVTPASTPHDRAQEVLAAFTTRLAPHFRAEEEALFPALRARLAPSAAEHLLLDALTDDHRRMTALRDQVAATADEDAVGPLLAAFADVLERHVRREERELFSRFDELVPDPTEAERLGADIRAHLARA